MLISCFCWPGDPVIVTPADGVSLLIASVFGVWFYTKEHWAANNMLGMGLAVTGIEFINLGSFQIGCILLVWQACSFWFFSP